MSVEKLAAIAKMDVRSLVLCLFGSSSCPLSFIGGTSPIEPKMALSFIRAGRASYMLSWYEKILLKLFRPRPARPTEGVSSETEIASVIVEFIRLADRANGLFGKDHLVSFAQHHPLGRTGATTSAGRLSLYFEPEARPLAPDFRFEFSEDHEGTIEFSVLGDYRYEGFHLSGQLTRPGAKEPRQNWPTPSLAVSAEPGIRSPVTRHAKRLRDVFVRNYRATDYRAMFK